MCGENYFEKLKNIAIGHRKIQYLKLKSLRNLLKTT